MSAASVASSSTSPRCPIASTISRRRSRRRPRPSPLLACGAEPAAQRLSSSRRRSLVRADDDRRPSITTSGAGHALASRPGGRARRRRGHRPRPLRGRTRRRGARRDRLALPPDHRRPRSGRLRRHQPTDRLRGAATRGRSWSPRPGCPGSRKPSTSPPAPPWTPPRPCGSGSGRGPPSPPPSRHTCCTSWPPPTRPSRIPQANPRSRICSPRRRRAHASSRSRPTVQPSNPRCRMHWTRPDVQARHPCHVQPCRPPIQRFCPPARPRPRPGRGRALPPYATRHATAPSRPSPRSQPPPTSPAAPPPPSSNHCAATPAAQLIPSTQAWPRPSPRPRRRRSQGSTGAGSSQTRFPRGASEAVGGRSPCPSTRAAVSRKVPCVLLDEPLSSAEHDLGRAPGRRAPGAEREAERGAERGHLEHAQPVQAAPAGLAAMAARALVGRLVGHGAKLR